jgi:LuxR family transcriptional regulator, maltose regulon positive regulatory protein
MVDFPHKIILPHRSPLLVSRPRLLAQLDVVTERQLLTVVAPAGYGKTSLLLDFAHHACPLPIGWYALDRFDDDPWVFLTYLTSAIEQLAPGSTAQTQTILASPTHMPFATAASALIRDVYAIQQPFALVLDDWHLVDHVDAIAEIIEKLLLYCPHCHLILASRALPSLGNLMLLTNRKQMSGIAEDELRFTAPEAAAVLHNEHVRGITDEEIRHLTERTNGWIAAIVLAARTPQADVSGTRFHPQAERAIYRFLAEQVFHQQETMIQTFLLHCALLEDLTAEQCQRIFQVDEAAYLLHLLARRHVFVSEIRPGVLRFHPLFREFLLEQFREQQPIEFRRIAAHVAGWYVEAEQWAQAFELFLIAGDRAAAQDVVARSAEALHSTGRLELLERWFDHLELHELRVSLLCRKAHLLLDRGKLHEAQAVLSLAEARMQSSDEAAVKLMQARLAYVTGRYEDALSAVCPLLHTTNHDPQTSVALRIAALCHQRLGQYATAIEQLEAALRIERKRTDVNAIAGIQQNLGTVYEAVGRIHEAAECYSLADAHYALVGNTGLRAACLNSKGVALHLLGRYREAHSTLQEARGYAQEAALLPTEADVCISLGDLFSDLGLWSQAQHVYSDATPLDNHAFMTHYLAVARVRLAVRQGQFEHARDGLDRLAPEVLEAYAIPITWLRILVDVHYGNARNALTVLPSLITQCKQQPMDEARGNLLHAYVLMHCENLDRTLFLAALDRAAHIAELLGHDGFLIAEAAALPSLLRRAAALGWSRAAVWLQRVQDLRSVACSLREATHHPLLTVRSFGTSQVLLNGQPVVIGWLRAREVLYYLLAHPEGVTADVLREAIWPDLPPDKSRNALKTAIYHLRSALPRNTIVFHGSMYAIQPQAVDIEYDGDRFGQLRKLQSRQPQVIFDLVDLYSGAYLPWSDNLWATTLRQRFEQQFVHALHLGAAWAEAEHQPLDALALHHTLLTIEPLNEHAHAGVMRCQIALGNRAAAINQYHVLQRALDRELGMTVAHSSEVERLYLDLLHQS